MFTRFDGILKQILPVIAPVLRKQRITDTEPGPVIRDFEIFIDFIASEKLCAIGKNELLPPDVLAELNARMTRPIEIRLKRPLQKSSNLQSQILSRSKKWFRTSAMACERY